jgi:putrescine transport system permease protein
MNPRAWPMVLGLGYAFLYLPILVLIVFSFNESRLVTVWTGWSWRWYGEVLANERLLEAAWFSVAIAALSATIATILGALAGFALARGGRFGLRWLLAFLLVVPLVMPEVISGLSFLLMFVAAEAWTGWPAERGLTTIVIAHATLGMAFVAVVVQARLADTSPSLEEAAADLGASPLTVFWRITLPLAWPALAAGWLLALTLSLDDLVIASFVSGPGATTLPMIVFSSVRLGVSPQINALASLLVIAMVGTALLAAFILRRRDGANRA